MSHQLQVACETILLRFYEARFQFAYGLLIWAGIIDLGRNVNVSLLHQSAQGCMGQHYAGTFHLLIRWAGLI